MNVDYRAEIIAWVDPDANGERHIFEEMLDQYEQQIRDQIAAEINTAADRTSVDNIAMGGRVLGLRAAARIARADTHQPIATDITPDGDAHDQINHDAYTL